MSAQLNNIVFNILPFRCNERGQRKAISEALSHSKVWELQKTEARYFMRYVTDNLQKEENAEVQMLHYMAKPETVRTVLPELQVPEHAVVYTENSGTEYPFSLKSLELFWFATGIGVLAIGVQYDETDPVHISCAEYTLKKAGRGKMKWTEADGTDHTMTLMELGGCLLQADLQESPFTMFFYDNPGHERANVMSYVEQTKDLDNWKELEHKGIFFLRSCYGVSFDYDPDEQLEPNQLHQANRNTIWGISRENIACIAYPDCDQSGFMNSDFLKHICSDYLLMYVLLLHQKYALYDLLMNIDTDTYERLDNLEGYQEKLHQFQAHFWFNVITEVPQYQNLYNKIRSRMSLDALMQDVKEPLDALVSQQREKENRETEKRAAEQARQDRRMNNLLFIISMLAVISAITDGFGILKEWPLKCSQWIFIIVIIVLIASMCVFFNWRAQRRERNSDDE